MASQPLLEVWERNLPGLTRLVAGMGLRPTTGEDVLQEVYLAALGSDARRLPPAELRRWLFRVAVNRCRLEHRKRSRLRSALAGLLRRRQDPPRPDVLEALAGRQELRAVRRALAGMEPDLKALLVMRYFCEMDSKEIGRVLGLLDSTVRGRLRTGRMKLAEALRKAGFGDE